MELVPILRRWRRTGQSQTGKPACHHFRNCEAKLRGLAGETGSARTATRRHMAAPRVCEHAKTLKVISAVGDERERIPRRVGVRRVAPDNFTPTPVRACRKRPERRLRRREKRVVAHSQDEEFALSPVDGRGSVAGGGVSTGSAFLFRFSSLFCCLARSRCRFANA